MGIYINTNDDLNEMMDLIRRLKTESGIKPCVDWTNTLSKVEKECCVCVINLTIFEESKVNLRSGGEIGLSNWFKMLTIAIVNPRNNDLKNELEKIGVHPFTKKDIVFVLDYISDLIMTTKRILKEFTGNDVGERRRIRGAMCEDFEKAIAQASTYKKINNLKSKY